MQAYRISPCARLSGCGPTSSSRTVPTFFPIVPSELTPLLRLLERPSGVATAPVSAPSPSRRCGRVSRSKNAAPYPRFDVKETDIAYELKGEFPGFKHEEISIDFVDTDTLVIRGHHNAAGVVESKKQSYAEVNSSEKEEASATPVAAAAESPNTLVNDDEEKKKRSNPYRVMVEDEDDEEFVDAGAEVSDGEATPATTIIDVQAQPIIEATPAARQEHSEGKDGQGKEEESKAIYWVHERATGRFERGFRFPSLVDRDNVKATLKDGILSIVVAKVEKRKERRIVVEWKKEKRSLEIDVFIAGFAQSTLDWRIIGIEIE